MLESKTNIIIQETGQINSRDEPQNHQQLIIYNTKYGHDKTQTINQIKKERALCIMRGAGKCSACCRVPTLPLAIVDPPVSG
jgi:2-hydroxy-3-keto-5-methylthiopentenyl-1-phosphate phosphatase